MCTVGKYESYVVVFGEQRCCENLLMSGYCSGFEYLQKHNMSTLKLTLFNIQGGEEWGGSCWLSGSYS